MPSILCQRAWISLCTLTVLFSVPRYDASAQLVDTPLHMPLDELGHGFWEYQLTSHSYNTPPPSLITIEIYGDTTIGGYTYKLLSEHRYTDSGQEPSIILCAVREDDSGTLSYIGFDSLYNRCDVSLYPLPYQTSYNIVRDTSIAIGGILYDVAETGSISSHGSAPGGAGGGSTVAYASGIGLYYANSYSRGRGGASVERTYELIYAEVAGKQYGVSVVSVDHPALRKVGLHVESVSPNPFQNEIRVTLGVASEGEISYELFDILGRVITAGHIAPSTKVATIKVGSRAAGIYILRLHDRFGRHFVTKVLHVPANQ